MPGVLLSLTSGMVKSALPHSDVDFTNILHGEQYLEIVDHLPTDGVLTTKGKVIDVMDKKSGAVVVTSCEEMIHCLCVILSTEISNFF